MTTQTANGPTTDRLAQHAGNSAPITGEKPAAATTLIRQEPGAILTLAEKSGNPMEFLSKMGESIAKSGMMGLKRTEQGSTLLMICMTEGKTPLQVISEFHVMDDGKLARKADWVISRFREMGGTFKIVDDGENGVNATYEFTFRGNTRQVTYSFKEAEAEGIVKAGGRWTKNPASMLRARVITKGVRMVAPEVMAGFYTEEELDGQTDGPVATASTATGATRGRPKKDQSASPPTTEPAASAASPAAAPLGESSQPAGEVVDAEYVAAGDSVVSGNQTATVQPVETAAKASTAKPPAGDPAADERMKLLLDLEFKLGQLGFSRVDYEAQRYAKFQDFETLDDMPTDKLKECLAKIEAGIAKKQQTAAS